MRGVHAAYFRVRRLNRGPQLGTTVGVVVSAPPSSAPPIIRRIALSQPTIYGVEVAFGNIAVGQVRRFVGRQRLENRQGLSRGFYRSVVAVHQSQDAAEVGLCLRDVILARRIFGCKPS